VILDAFIQAVRDQELGAYGVELTRTGHDPVEHRFRSDDRVNLYSVAKTFTSLAVGLAEAEGRLSLDDRLLDHFPSLRPFAADGVEAVTLRHLLTMTSGSSHRWYSFMPVTAPDLLQEFVAAPLDAPPGTRFMYTGSGPYALSRVIARVTGADLRAYLGPRLFDPLGLHNPQWFTDPLGHSFGDSDLFLRTGELARVARLLLQDGIWDGRPVLPAGWVRRMPAETVDTSDATRGPQYTHGYGLGVWLDRNGTYRMDGLYGQYAVISPSRQAAVTVTAHTERDADLLTAIHTTILDRL
jgi:CubicO group peptidase (beta-lactamase class C family)